jgi:dihydrofolate synthase / folylpolyglutamate synthase
MTYRDLLERLLSARRAGMVFGLERIQACLAALGHPERRPALRVQIAGTNGKGSTAAFTAALVRAGGRRVGLFTSPHLTSLRERFTVDGALPEEAAVVEAAEAVWAAGGEGLTFFEQTTAIGLELFARAGVEIAILEVGLGGRLDSTTAVPCEVAAVTGVALDHQEYLGDTLAQIAAEKGAIFAARGDVAARGGVRAVIGASGEPDGVALLAEAARAAGVRALTVVDGAFVDARVPAGLRLGLAGAHQRANAACALAIADHLEALGAVRIPDAARAGALAATRHPGRLETVATAPAILLDGAHNPHGARALAAALADLAGRPRVLVLGLSADKDLDGILAPLLPVADAVVATRYQQPRALAEAALAARIPDSLPTETAPDIAAALDRARAIAGPAGLIVVAGSLFLVGEARALLVGGAIDPVVLTDPVGKR